MPRLLLVEDDSVTYTALRTLLTLRGWDVAVATTLRDARPLLAEGRPSVLILDLMLPDGDGGVLFEEIRRAGLPVKVVVQTGVNDGEWLGRIMRLGPDLMLKKPIDLNQLVRFLAQNRSG